MIATFDKVHGKCSNAQPIRGLTECQGACSSGTIFNTQTFKQDKKCQCCMVANYMELKIPLICADGSIPTIPVSVPKTCSCQPCDGNVLHELVAA